MDTAARLSTRVAGDGREEFPNASKIKYPGQRRPLIVRVCACGCGKQFKTTHPKKIYLDDTHRMRAWRAQRVEM